MAEWRRLKGSRIKRPPGPGVACLLSLLICAVSAPATAQSPPARVLPAQAIPAPASPLPGIAPLPPPTLPPPLPLPAEPRENPVPAVTVPIASVVVEGSTIYPAERFAPLLAGLTGPAVELARIEAARIGVLQRYRDDGYALTAVTAIVAPGGVLRLRVTEGRIAEVKLDGDIGSAGVQVLRFLHVLTEKPAIDTATLERQLLLASDVPGVTVRAVLRPSTDQPGALTLVAQVSRRAVSGQVTLDNRAFERVGPVQALGVLDLNSFSEFGEHTQIELYRTLDGAQLFGQVETSAFIGASGLRIRLYGGSGTSEPTGSFRTIGYVGRTTIFGAELDYPLIRSRQQTLNLAGIFDVVEGRITQTGQPPSSDELRVVRLGADYVVSDALLGAERGAVNALSVRVSRGLLAFGAARNGLASAARAGQQNDFVKGTLDLSRTQTLFQPWDGAVVSLFGVVSGQLSRAVLPSPEKFFLGGSRLARGFYYGEVTGDSALAASVELQLTVATEFPLFGAPRPMSAQFYGFYDWGEAWDNPAGEPGRRLRSAGLGVRLMPASSLEVDLEGVHRFTRFPTGSGAGITALAGNAFYWRILARF